MSEYRRVSYSVGTPDSESSGVVVTYWTRKGEVVMTGWFDSMVGIEPVSYTLGDFLRRLGLTAEEVVEAMEGQR